ncbi:MAG: hypothetical protein AABZ41_09065, partial [Bacteroidota bacterium]
MAVLIRALLGLVLFESKDTKSRRFLQGKASVDCGIGSHRIPHTPSPLLGEKTRGVYSGKCFNGRSEYCPLQV